ncbi:hypothetical protein J2741_001496 [Methanolinea mesophila]|uniref:hypothetical protein n=1 Tax=Methanolinea mesophila TaxID=547055 RepID=UPI001AE59458|nr:hypothetical protein [Methanolinea mesophila]MBP1928949.1 hypothetical protein [Methanolinea mesophila]
MSRTSRKISAVEYEVCRILREQGWNVVQCTGASPPLDILAIRKNEILLLMVRSPKRALRDGHEVSLFYHEDLARFRAVGGDIPNCRKEAWINSPQYGLMRFHVYPGGISKVVPGMDEENPTDIIRPVRGNAGMDVGTSKGTLPFQQESHVPLVSETNTSLPLPRVNTHA